jgi:RNA polymerase sigma-70 factor (ECF subfamily)
MSTATTQDLAADAQQREMVRRLKDGDQDVLNDILQSLGGVVLWKLRQTFFPLFKEPDLEEIVGDALFRVWESRDAFDPERGSLLSWFLRIARNVALDYRKCGWRQAQEKECAFPYDDWQAPEPAFEDDEAEGRPASVAYQDLVKILDTLEEKDRQIILAYARCAGEGSWTGPLVDELGMSAGAIRTRAHRLLRTIRREMQNYGHDADSLSERVL